MKRWGIRLTLIALAAFALLGSLYAVANWYWNRDVAPPTLAEKQQSYRRAVGWIHANEARILKDGNSALWMMVQTAADRAGDDYLKGLVQQSVQLAYGNGGQTSPWKRIVYPKADITLNQFSMRPLGAYQRFFYHAVTCQPVELDDGRDTSAFLDPGLCHPQATQIYLRDSVCSTHQLFGVKLLERTGCATQADLPQLEASLLADIDQQMRWDVVFKDAYIQRVLMLLWAGGPDRVKAVWMQRVLSAQQADGGWIGIRHAPELPDRLQPWNLIGRPTPTNFHATAQGLLIAALAMTEKPR